MSFIIEQINNIIQEKNNPERVEELCNDLIASLNKNFINSLTLSELEVFNILKKKLGNNTEIIISSSAFALECQTSRTTVSTLLTKMKNAQIAETQNLGVKGTLIQILNKNLFKE